MTRQPIPQTSFGLRHDAEIAIQIVSILTGHCEGCPNRGCKRAQSCAWQHPTCYDRARAEGRHDFDGALDLAGTMGLLAPLPNDPLGLAHIEKLQRMRGRLTVGRLYMLRHQEDGPRQTLLGVTA